MLLVLHVPPKQLISAKARTLQDFWRCPVASGIKIATDSWSPVSCKVGSARIGLLVLAHPTDARPNRDLWNLEARATPWTPHVHERFEEQCVQCGRTNNPAERGLCHQGTPPPWRSVPGVQRCLSLQTQGISRDSNKPNIYKIIIYIYIGRCLS